MARQSAATIENATIENSAEDTTVEETTSVQTETTDETTTKRERVDIEKLAAENPNEKVTLAVSIPAGLKLAIKQRADADDLSETQFVRNLLAAQFEYTIPESFTERRGRTGKYSGMTEEDKAAAIKAENEKKRNVVSNVLAALHENEAARDILLAMGINPDDLPKPRARKNGDS